MTRSVNVTGNTSDAFSTVDARRHHLPRAPRAGARLHAARALRARNGDFDDAAPVKRAGCGGYFLYTPAAGEGGRTRCW